MRAGEHQHRGDGNRQLLAVGAHEVPDASHDAAVKDAAEHVFFDTVRADDCAGRAASIVADVAAFNFEFFAHGWLSALGVASPDASSGRICRRCSAA